MAYFNDTQPVIMNNDVVTNQPPPYYNQGEQGFYPNPQGFPYAQPTPQGFPYAQPTPQMPAAPIGPEETYFQSATPKPLVIDYCNVGWSVFNTCCCLWPVGLIALIVSIVTLRKRQRDNDPNAKIWAISAAIINVLATIGGILLFTLFLIPRMRN